MKLKLVEDVTKLFEDSGDSHTDKGHRARIFSYIEKEFSSKLKEKGYSIDGKVDQFLKIGLPTKYFYKYVVKYENGKFIQYWLNSDQEEEFKKELTSLDEINSEEISNWINRGVEAITKQFTVSDSLNESIINEGPLGNIINKMASKISDKVTQIKDNKDQKALNRTQFLNKVNELQNQIKITSDLIKVGFNHNNEQLVVQFDFKENPLPLITINFKSEVSNLYISEIKGLSNSSVNISNKNTFKVLQNISRLFDIQINLPEDENLKKLITGGEEVLQQETKTEQNNKPNGDAYEASLRKELGPEISNMIESLLNNKEILTEADQETKNVNPKQFIQAYEKCKNNTQQAITLAKLFCYKYNPNFAKADMEDEDRCYLLILNELVRDKFDASRPTSYVLKHTSLIVNHQVEGKTKIKINPQFIYIQKELAKVYKNKNKILLWQNASLYTGRYTNDQIMDIFKWFNSPSALGIELLTKAGIEKYLQPNSGDSEEVQKEKEENRQHVLNILGDRSEQELLKALSEPLEDENGKLEEKNLRGFKNFIFYEKGSRTSSSRLRPYSELDNIIDALSDEYSLRRSDPVLRNDREIKKGDEKDQYVGKEKLRLGKALDAIKKVDKEKDITSQLKNILKNIDFDDKKADKKGLQDLIDELDKMLNSETK